MKDNQLRRFIILGFIGAALLIVGIFAFIQGSTNQSSQPEQTEWVDPASGDTLQDTQGKTPEKYGVDPNQPAYLGFAELLDRGMLLEEVDNTKSFLTDYVNKQIKEGKTKITRLSIEEGSVQHKIQSDAHEESFVTKLITDNGQSFILTVTTNADTNQRTLSLTEGANVVYSATQNM